MTAYQPAISEWTTDEVRTFGQPIGCMYIWVYIRCTYINIALGWGDILENIALGTFTRWNLAPSIRQYLFYYTEYNYTITLFAHIQLPQLGNLTNRRFYVTPASPDVSVKGVNILISASCTDSMRIIDPYAQLPVCRIGRYTYIYPMAILPISSVIRYIVEWSRNTTLWHIDQWYS